METKQIFRQKILRLRKDISPRKRTEAGNIILDTLIARAEYNNARCICIYASLPEEVDTRQLLEHSFSIRKRVVVPRVDRQTIHLYRISSPDDLSPGSFGISEPKQACPEVSVSSIDGFIVPGIAFDRQGYRLGWGKGYYDKLLATVSAQKVGLAYDVQIVAGLPREKYDIPMDVIISEKEIIVPQKEV